MRLKEGNSLDAGVATSTSLEEARPKPGLKQASGDHLSNIVFIRIYDGLFTLCHHQSYHVFSWEIFSL